MQNKNNIKKKKLLAAVSNINESISNSSIKQKAIDFIANNDFPNNSDEGWRHTNLASIFNLNYKTNNFQKEKIDINDFEIENLDADRIVFENGSFRDDLSQIISKIVIVDSLTSGKIKHPEIINKYVEKSDTQFEDNFTALNTAFAAEGSLIYVPDAIIADKPIHIINIDTGKESRLNQVKNIIIVGNNANVNIIESYYSYSNIQSFTNIVTDTIIGENAFVDWVKISHVNSKLLQINHQKVIQEANSSFTCNTITLSGGLIRNSIKIDLKGEGCQTFLYGLYIVNDNNCVDNYTYLNHAVPHGTSNQIYKGIIDDKASAVFFGKVYVAKDAQKTDANQSNKNVLVSEEAKVNSKPQLEIYADDVSCSHGSTIGQLDEEAVFYMQSRGIDKREAKLILLYGFMSDLIEKVKNVSVKEHVDKTVRVLLNRKL